MNDMIMVSGAEFEAMQQELEARRAAEAVEKLYDTYNWYDRENGVQIGSAVHKILSYAPGVFFLGGSRRMKQLYDEQAGTNATLIANSPYKSISGPSSQTDWDFYATWSPAMEQTLQQMGFRETPYSKTVRVLRTKDYASLTEDELTVLEAVAEDGEYALDDEAVTILKKGNVQIVLRLDALFYKRVFDNIPSDVYETLLWKSSPTTQVNRALIQPLFNTFFKIAHAAESY